MNEVPQSFQWGISSCRGKDHSVFIFISEEIKKKKNLGINVKQVFLLLFLSADEAEVKLDGTRSVVTPD